MALMSSVPCVILAGGKGTRLSEETKAVPKPMLMVGNKPLLQHVIDSYRMQGVTEFIIPVGHLKESIFQYFENGPLLNTSSVSRDGVKYWFMSYVREYSYTVQVVDTGEDTLTGGRLKRIAHYLGDRTFNFTYGDGLGNVDVIKVWGIHTSSHKNVATITAVHPEGRFGRMVLGDNNRVVFFGEKSVTDHDWINGGFSVLSPRILGGIKGDDINLEKDVYPIVAKYGYMQAVPHLGYWKAVDTLRDLEDIRHTYEKEGSVWQI